MELLIKFMNIKNPKTLYGMSNIVELTTENVDLKNKIGSYDENG